MAYASTGTKPRVKNTNGNVNFPSIERYSPRVSRFCWSTAYINSYVKNSNRQVRRIERETKGSFVSGEVYTRVSYVLAIFVHAHKSLWSFFVESIPLVHDSCGESTFFRRVNRTNEDTLFS